MMATAAPPMATPAMSPVEKPEWEGSGAVEVGAAVGEVEVGVGGPVEKGSGVLSAGHGWPGWSMKVEFNAYCFWTARTWVALGLMAPTMP